MAYLTLGAEDDALQGPILDPDTIRRSVAWRDVVRFHVGAPLRAALDEPPMPSVLPRAQHEDAADDEDASPAIGQWESPRLSQAQCEIVSAVRALLTSGRLRAYGRRAGPGGVWEWIPRTEWQRVTAIEPNVMPWLALFQPLADTFLLHSGEPAWCDVAVVPCPRDDAYGDLPPPPPLEACPGWVKARHAAISARPKNSTATTTAAALRRCEAWFLDLVRAHPHGRPKPKPDLRQQAADEFAVSGRQFDLIWQLSAPESWKSAGAPRKTPAQRNGPEAQPTGARLC